MFIAQWKKATLFRSWLKPWPEPMSPASSLPVDARLPFTVEEWEELQQEDRSAAARFLGIIFSAFALGLTGYSIIALIVSHGW